MLDESNALIYVAVWVASGVAAMWVAKARKRHERGPSWFGAGLVLGPVAVLLALVLPNPPKEPVSFAPPTPVAPTGGFCPTCGAARLAGARFCASCGRELAMAG